MKLSRVPVAREAVQLPTSQDLKSKMTWTSEDLDSDSMLNKTLNGNIICKELVSQLVNNVSYLAVVIIGARSCCELNVCVSLSLIR